LYHVWEAISASRLISVFVGMCIDGNYAAEIPAADGHWQNWRKTGT